MAEEMLDHRGRPIIAVTGLGVVSSLGRGKADNWQALSEGRSGIHPIERFPAEGLATTIAGTVDFIESEGRTPADLSYAFAELAAAEALDQAGLGVAFEGPLFLAAPPVETEWPQRFALDGQAGDADIDLEPYQRMLAVARRTPHTHFYDTIMFGSIAERLSERFSITGLPVTLSTACASGATSIQLGVEAIRRGETNRALTVGTDGSITAEALIRFSLLSALSTRNEEPQQASRPFSKDRTGFVMAEGAGALVLESLQSARDRGAQILGIVRGVGEKADAFHRTRSSPDGGPATATIRAALDDAGPDAQSDIGYINAHGTSTPENDKMEFLSLSNVFGDALAGIPVSSNKSMIGHTLTAAGAIEAVFSLLTIAHQLLPPTINYETPDPAIPLDVVPNTARAASPRAVLSNSFGFGGQNVSLVLGAVSS